MKKLECRPYQPKTMVNKLKHVDSWFWIRYTLNPYRGCAHLCVYCDARANQYGLADTFDQVVYYKGNAAEVLEKQLPKLKRDIVGMGGVCDAYQPLEQERRVTRQVLETLARHGFPVQVLTKSDLVLRDLDLFQEIDERAWAGVLFTITTVDPQVASYFEPYAPSPERRLAAMARVAEAGLTTGVMLCPLLPGISDDDAHIEEVVRRAKEAGAGFILACGLTLKKGAQRERYMSALETGYPHLISRYEQLYSEGYAPNDNYSHELYLRARAICRKHNIPDRMPRPAIKHDRLATNKRMAAYLAAQVYELEMAGAKSYKIWACRKAGWALDDLEQDVALVYERMGAKGLESIRDVGPSLGSKLEAWLRAEGFEGPAAGER